MTNERIDSKVMELELLEAQIKELKAIAESIKADLKSELDTRKVDCIETELNRVHYTVYSKKTVDTKKLKDANLYDEFAKEQTIVTFKVTHKLSE